MSKPNKDGWIRHRGKMQPPVEPGTIIDVRYRNGDIDEASEVGEGEEWLHEGSPYDVMAWRPHKPVEQRIIEAEQSALAAKANEEAEMPAAKYFDGPIQWRDLIREIDSEQKAADEAYKEATDHRAAQRAYLVAKLKAEGFVLVDEWSTLEPSEIQVKTRRVEDIAQKDMSDPANWRVGDLVEIESSTNDGWMTRKGMLGRLKWDGEWIIDFSEHGCSGWYLSDNTEVKWHSRPPQ